MTLGVIKYIFTPILILLLATTAFASTTATHDLEIQLSGEWKLDTSTQLPNASTDLSLDGVGDAWIKSYLTIIHIEQNVDSWWDLF